MNNIEINSTKIEGLMRLERKVFNDSRGSFFRVFDEQLKKYIQLDNLKTQINVSVTEKKGTIRGMHFQYPPYAEKKIVTCLVGKVIDIVIDLRKESKTFMCSHSEILCSKEANSILIPEGFAHGFQALEDNSHLIYIHSNLYKKSHESGIHPMDPFIDIKWPIKESMISEKDNSLQLIKSKFNGIEI
ncbi:dTDP-4-dehydrorhamnose 3,5-epimerase family protein [Alphaproteobacteria bacterium]|nr:dTDP-4-dehydrorhamnose 3,5-epimerase family protein [Alphaproteobacteria bacterium]